MNERGPGLLVFFLAVLARLVGPPLLAADDADCLACHGLPAAGRPAGKSAPINLEALRSSAHGKAGLACIDCHADLASAVAFPHAAKLKPAVCADCHDSAAAALAASPHAGAGSCAECHGGHDIRPPTDPRSKLHPDNVRRLCGQCHVGAGRDFSRGKVHEARPPTENRWVRLVRVLYTALISTLVLLFVVYIAADLGHGLKKRWRKN
ncbi:MAG TPA: cytochrome c3 family protein [Burkholderiales bacterium]|nr:cytochrome c3 family protein [Burkholderiales bacterium]